MSSQLGMDFTKLRAAALKDGDDEEAVTVNTRALIDKVGSIPSSTGVPCTLGYFIRVAFNTWDIFGTTSRLWAYMTPEYHFRC